MNVRHIRSFLAIAMLCTPGAFAQSTWDGGGTNNNWSFVTNWLGDVAPGNPTTNFIYLSGTTRLTPFVDADWQIQGLVISNNAGGFAVSGSNLTITANTAIPTGAQVFEHRGPSNVVVANNIILPATALNVRRQFLLNSAASATFSGIISNSGPEYMELWLRGNNNGGGAATTAGTLAQRVLVGTNKLIKADTVTWVIGTNGNVWGATEIYHTGVLRIAAADAIPTNSAVTFNSLFGGGRVDLNNFNQTLASLTGTGGVRTGTGAGGILTLASDASSNTFVGAISENGALVKMGNSHVTLGAASSFTGNLTVAGGTLQGGQNRTLQPGTTFGSVNNQRRINVQSGAILSLQGRDLFSGTNITIAIAGTFTNDAYTQVGSIILNGGAMNIGNGTSGTNFQSLEIKNGITVTGVAASTINGLTSGTGTSNGIHLGQVALPIVVNDVTGDASPDLTINAVLANQSGNSSNTAGGLSKSGSGRLLLTATNRYSGPTVIAAGELALGPEALISFSTSVVVNASATLDVSVVTGGYTIPPGQTIQGDGRITGSVHTTSSSRILPGSVTAAGTLTIEGTQFDMDSAYTNTFNLTNNVTEGGGNDLLVYHGEAFVPNSSQIRIVPIAPLTSGTYRLINYTGLKLDNFAADVLGNTSRDTWMLDQGTPGQVNLLVSALTNRSLRWTAQNSADWDLAATNWTAVDDAAQERFFDNDIVLFDDVGAASNIINLTAAVRPTLTTVDAASNYTLSGTGRVTGFATESAQFVKAGTGTLTVLTANDHQGLTVVSNGTLLVGSGGAAGQVGAGPVFVGAPGILGFYRNDTALNVSNRLAGDGSIVFMGTGVSNQSGYVLSGVNTGFAGSVTITNARLSADQATDLGAATNVNVQERGQLYVIGITATNPATLAGLGWQETAGQLGAIRLQAATYGGPITLAGNARIGAYSGTGALSGAISGPFELELWAGEAGGRSISMGAPVLNTYGSTRISSNVTVILTNANAISTGPLTMNGGTLRLNGNNVTVSNLSFTAATGTIYNGATNAGAVLALGMDGQNAAYGINFVDNPGYPSAQRHLFFSSLGFTKLGAGTVSIGNNAATGTNLVNAGTLVITNGSWNGPLTIAGGATAVAVGGVGLLGEYFLAAPTSAAFNTLPILNGSLGGMSPALLQKSTTAGTNFSFGNAGGSFPAGFNTAGVTSNFLARWMGKLTITNAGLYAFATASDDGSMLWIDGTNIVNNNFVQGMTERTGQVALAVGIHDIVYAYYQGSGSYGMTNNIIPPGDVKQLMPNGLLSSGPGVGSLDMAAGSTLQVSNGLLLVAQSQPGNVAGTISGNGGFIKTGPATLQLHGTASHTDATVVAGGRFEVQGSISNSPVTVISGGALGGTGMVYSPVAVSEGGIVTAGGAGQAGTLGLTQLSLQTTGTNVIDWSSAANDQMAVVGALTAGQSILLVNPLEALVDGVYPLATYGSLVSPYRAVMNGNTNVGGAKSLGLDYSTPGTIKLVVASRTGGIVWNSNSNTAWNVQQSVNWSNTAVAAPDFFYQGDAVRFDDTPGVTQLVVIASGVAVSPSSITVDTSTNNYTLQIVGAITGAATFVKNGTGTVTVSDTTGGGGVSQNFATGDVQINAGRVVLLGQNDGSRVLGSGTVTVNAGGILQSENNNAFGLQTVFVQPIVVNGGILRPASNTHMHSLVLQSNGVIEAHTSASGTTGLDWYSIGGTNAEFHVRGSSATVTNFARMTISNNPTNTIMDIADNLPAIDAVLAGKISGAGNRLLVFTNTGTTLISGTDDNNSLRIQVNTGTVILGKTSSALVHAVGDGGDIVILNGGRVQLGGTGGDQLYTQGDVRMNGGVFDFAGFSDGYDALNGASGVMLNSSAGTVSTNTVGENNAVGLFSGSIQDGAGQVVFRKTGTNVQTLAGASTYSGDTLVHGGILVLSNSVGNAIVGPVTLGDTSGNDVLLLARPDQMADGQVVSFVSGTSSGNGGKFQLSGNSETVGGVSTVAGTFGVIQNMENETVNSDATLTLNVVSNLVYDNFMRDRSGGTGTGRLHLVKSGEGTQVLGGANLLYSGTTTVSNGTLAINGTLAASPVVVAGGTLAGTGSLLRAVAVNAGAVVQPGYLSSASALTATTLTVNAGANLRLLAAGTASVLRVTGNNGLTLPSGASVATVAVLSASSVGTNLLVDYAGVVQGGSVAANLQLVLPPRAAGSLVDNLANSSIDLNVTSVAEPIKWTGATDANWDIGTKTNWTTQVGAQSTAYLQDALIGDSVLFDDSASGNFAVALGASVKPAALAVSNNVNDYSISGGAIAGSASLVKQGSAMLTLSNVALSQASAMQVNGGTLKLDNVLDVGNSIINASTVELFAAAGNWSMGSNRSLSGAGVYRKTGAGTVSLYNSVMSASGRIEVAQGTLRADGNGSVWTANAAALDVAASSVFDMNGDAVRVSALSGSGTVTNSTGYSVVETFTVGVGNGSGVFTGTLQDGGRVTNGPGNAAIALVKTGTGTQTMAGVLSYVGLTFMDAGTLALTVDQPTNRGLVFGASVGSTTAGTLDLSSASMTTASLSNQVNSATQTNVIALGAGRSLTVNGPVTIGPVVSGAATLQKISGGSFTVNDAGGTMRIANASGAANAFSRATLDLTDVGAVAINLGQGTLQLGNGDNSGSAAASSLRLGATNTIVAGQLGIGIGSNGSLMEFLLGSGTTVLNVDTFNAGTGARDRANVAFSNATGTLVLRDRTGTNRAALNFSRTAIDGTGYAGDGYFDVRGHYSDLFVTTLNVGVAGRNGSTTNTFSFDTGILDMQSLRMALFKTNGALEAVLNVGGGTVNIGTNGVTLGSNGVAKVNLTGGTITSGSDFLRGSGIGTTIVTLAGATLNLQGRTLGGTTPINTLAFQSGALVNIGQVNNGAAWTKSTTGTLVIAGTNGFTSPVTVDDGTLQVDGLIAGGGGITVNAGTLAGSGVVSGAVVCAGSLAPGGSPGRLTLQSDLFTAGNMTIELAGTTPATGHDQLRVGGTAALLAGATLTVVTNAGHNPSVGSSYTVLTATAVSGTFTTTNLPILSAAGAGWTVTYLPGAVVLSVTGAPSATGYDLAALVITNGLTGYQDDADADGYANLLEYATGGSLTNADTQSKMNGSRTNGLLTLRFSRDTNAVDATMIVEGSDSAANGAVWLGIATNSGGLWAATNLVSETVSGNPVTVTVSDNVAGTNRFLRLRVTRP